MIRKFLYFCGLSLLGLLAALGYAYWCVQNALHQPLQVEDALLLDVEPGATPSGLFRNLEQQGVIEGGLWLRLYWRLDRPTETLHHGEYRLTDGMTVEDLLGLWRRREVVQYQLTLVEGWTFRQFREALQAAPKLDQQLAGLSDAELMAELGRPDQHPEGRFFPDTYSYTRGLSDRTLLQQALQRQQQLLDSEWAGRAEDLPYADPYQALIMASIIERETGVPEERGQIAGVFVRRLQQGMRLQTDPTVIYGMGEAYAGRISRADLRRPTPYNTYTIKGLPPTPIAMPGQAAIHAALHPEAGQALYFVARGDGSHQFSATLTEHNRAVRKFQLRRRQDYRSSPAPATHEEP